MRATLATDFDGSLYELVTIHETPRGVYLAFCTPGTDLHASYHSDGARHYKYRGQRLPFDLDSATPLAEVTIPQQVTGTAIRYLPDHLSPHRPLRHNRRRRTLVLLTHAVFPEALTLNSYVLSQDHQDTLITSAYRDYNTGGFVLVGLNLFELEHFAGKLIALIFYKGIPPAQQKR